MSSWNIRRGDIIMCDLGLHSGSVQSGIRPCVVVSNDTGNIFSNVYTVVPLTSKHKNEIPTHVLLGENSLALCEQCTTISDQQVLRKKGFVDTELMQDIDQSLKIALDLK